jgi:hypothetical protein
VVTAEQVFSLLQSKDGLLAREIADILNAERSMINSLLYGPLQNKCYRDDSYRWHITLRTTTQATPQERVKTDDILSKLCKYYLNCLSVDTGNGIWEYANSIYNDFNYVEVPDTRFRTMNEQGKQLIVKAERTRNMASFFGYPVIIDRKYSRNNNQPYYTLAPIFLYAIENNDGQLHYASIPSINMEAIRLFSEADTNNQIHDLIALENKLSLNSNNIEIDIDDLMAGLQNERSWPWMEPMDANRLSTGLPLSQIQTAGIYNRAVIMITEKSPYTIGLEAELSKLSSIEETSYKNTALYQWIHGLPDSKIINSELPLLEVLPLNTEQHQAI